MRSLFLVVGILIIPALLQAQNSGEYWRDRQYADRVRAEERRHQLEIERIRSRTAIEVASQNRRFYHYYRPPIVGQPVNVVAPTRSKTTIITHRSLTHPNSTVLYRSGRTSRSVTFEGPGFSYSSSSKKRVRTIGIGR